MYICLRKVVTLVRGVDIDQAASAIPWRSVTREVTVPAPGGESSPLLVRDQLREWRVAVTDQLDET